MQHPQATVAQQPGVFAPKGPLQFNPQQMQERQQQQHQIHHQHQQAIQGHIAMRPGVNNGMLAMHNEATLGGGSGGSGPPSTVGLAEFPRGGASSGSLEVQGGSKQAVPEAGSGDGQGNSTAGRGGADEEQSYLKGSEVAN